MKTFTKHYFQGPGTGAAGPRPLVQCTVTRTRVGSGWTAVGGNTSLCSDRGRTPSGKTARKQTKKPQLYLKDLS